MSDQTNGEWLRERIIFGIVLALVIAGFFVIVAAGEAGRP